MKPLLRRLTGGRRAQLDADEIVRDEPARPRMQRRYGGIGGSPCSSPPVMNTVNSHGQVPLWPRRRTHARAAVASASTAFPSGEPAGMIAPCSASNAYAQPTPEQRNSSGVLSRQREVIQCTYLT